MKERREGLPGGHDAMLEGEHLTQREKQMLDGLGQPGAGRATQAELALALGWESKGRGSGRRYPNVVAVYRVLRKLQKREFVIRREGRWTVSDMGARAAETLRVVERDPPGWKAEQPEGWEERTARRLMGVEAEVIAKGVQDGLDAWLEGLGGLLDEVVEEAVKKALGVGFEEVVDRALGRVLSGEAPPPDQSA